MEKMLKKLKRFMVVAAAAVTLSVGFATFAPKEASAHWADKQMNWAMSEGYLKSDMRDSLATRQDAWLILSRYYGGKRDFSYEQARQFVIRNGISDGSRGTNWITRNEMVGMLYQKYNWTKAWTPEGGFSKANAWGKARGLFDGTRGNDFATRAEVITILYRHEFFWLY
ncbi:protein phosphatase 2C [Bacillus sp. MB353a]|nr:protein phosphatase 2C [Bacillus sp. MB353a]THG55581.1 protein phosphatase 2C [Bacillus sp. HUB-I-004]